MNLRKAASGLLTTVESAIAAGDWKVDGACDPTVAVTALRQALADAQMARLWEQKQEPVAWMSIDCIGERYLCFSKPTDNDQVQPLYTAPVDAVNISQECVDETEKGEQKTPLKALNLTVFTENRLRNGRVYDVETLQTMTNRDILAIPDIGKKALAEVLEALAKLKENNSG